MDVTENKAANTTPTFRRYKNGESVWDWSDNLQGKIFQQDKSYKCPTYVHRAPPCQGGCPSGHDIRGWLSIARGMDKSPIEGEEWQAYAFRRMVEANPFPSTMGRVCPAPCQNACNRNDVDEYVGINALEHYIGDWAIDNKLPLPAISALTGKHVAVIGGGPAGLSAAWFLRQAGHAVTIFEEKSQLGGMMRFGIPGYRTPRAMLDAEIGRITGLDGVTVKTGIRVGRDISFESVDKDFDAVFWGIGAQSGRTIPVPGADAPNCISGVSFLDAFNRGQLKSTEKRILVIGGGDTSIDVACVARRIGHIDQAGQQHETNVDVVLSSLFQLEKMTAAQPEREDALREGVDIQAGVMPLEFIKDAEGMIHSARMCQCTMKGMIPEPVPGTEYEVAVDLVVLAIGQSADLSEGLGALASDRGGISVDGTLRVKGQGKHFSGGDALRPHLLTTAIGHGRIAAETIDHFLNGVIDERRPKVDVRAFDMDEELSARHLTPTIYDHQQKRGTDSDKYAIHNYEDRASSSIVKSKELYKSQFPYDPCSQRPERHVNHDEVLGDFEERIKPISEEQARHEGKRCMSCGLCFECDNCVIYCPQTAVSRVKKSDRAVGRYVQTDYTKCIGCHICADVCPTGYIQMGLGE